MKASFSEYLSAREDWVQDILGYYTKSLPAAQQLHYAKPIYWVLRPLLSFNTILTNQRPVPNLPLDVLNIILLIQEQQNYSLIFSEHILLVTYLGFLFNNWETNTRTSELYLKGIGG